MTAKVAAGIGVPVATALLAAAFRGPDQAHWRRLAIAHGTAGLFALATDRSVRRFSPTVRDLCVAAPVGLGLFAVSSGADMLATRFAPQVTKDAEFLRSTSANISAVGMCALLAGVVAPGEELFWRDLVQNQLATRCGPGRAAMLSTAIYGAAHVGTGNSAVTGAALCLGTTLATMRARGASVERLALTHACWVIPTLLRARRAAAKDRAVEDSTADGERRDVMKISDEPARGRLVSQRSRLVQRANNVLHVALYEKTRGRLGTRMLKNEVAILTTARRKDGSPYSVPVFAFRDGADVIVVASYRGSTEHPAWFRNLRENPAAAIRVGDRSWPVRATVMDAAERAVWWPRVVAGFSGYASYQRRTSREIPVIRLSPEN